MARPKQKPFSASDIALTMSATSLSLAGLRSDDLPTVLLCLLVACSCFVFLVVVHTVTIWKRSTTIFGVLILFAAFALYINHKQDESSRSDVFEHLEIEMGPIDKGSPVVLLYTLRNASSHKIQSHQDSCVINAMVSQTGSGWGHNFSGKVIVPAIGDTGEIDSGGAGETGRCDISRIGFTDPIACMDVTMKVEYQVSSITEKLSEKSIRFVASQETGPHWFVESPNTPGNYCQGIMGSPMAK